ncbi:MAG: sn-glycerol-3-phosphate ABC transporter ATP-binding protein UgpC [Deltaproteobacteria bacterium]|nr:sn-glycerol-3-phosphate ABC transporter ATP-binding protein UgpC [Deltaproteobacteria bacterium]
MAKVILENVTKQFGTVQAVKDFNLTVEDKEFAILVGPSGCGKSTALRMIAGLEEPNTGTISIGDRVVNDLPPKDRDIAMVFQEYALYPHMSVYKNMAFGLKLRKFPKNEIDQRVRDAAEILSIQDFLDRKPKQLSGGQRQRVAVGRAIVRKPAVFLFDEPLSNLDAKLRVQMRAELSKLHDRLQTTIIYVTHDQVEAMTMGTKIVVMKDGWIQQVGSPLGVYNYPVNLFVAGFIGSPVMNFIPCRIISKDNRLLMDAESFQLPIPEKKVPYYQSLAGSEVIFGIRPNDIYDRAFAPENIKINTVRSVIDVIEPLGSEIHLNVTAGKHDLIAAVDVQTVYKVHQELELAFDLNRMHLFQKEPPNLRVKTEQ